MSTRSTRILRWLAAGTSFTACLLSSGCASREPVVASAPDGQVMANRAAVIAISQLPQEPPEPSPGRVDAFGDFGQRQGAAPMAGENALQQHTACDDGYDADAALNPAGDVIAFASTRHSERPDIYLQRVDGTAVVQLTSDAADDAHPAFSPDGKLIAFASTRAGTWDLYVMDTEGKSVQQVTSTPAQEMHPGFSPDGTRLVYCSLSPRSDQWELWTINLATQERRMIGYGLFPAWSPQKNVDRIAFQRARQRGSRLFSVWTMDLVDGEPRRLTEVAVSSNAAAVCPAWSPDGSRLAFTTILAPGEGEDQPARQDVWLVGADGAGRQRLTHGAGTNIAPFWGVNNRIYFVSDRGGRENVWSVRAGEPAAAPGTLAGTPAKAHEPPPATTPHPAPEAVGSVDTGEAHH